MENSIRTKEDLCLLCLNQKATKTNSHIISAGILKGMIGKRDYEESYQLDTASKSKVDNFYGRSNLENEEKEKKENHHTLNYIFCPKCENRLGIVESEVIPFINEHTCNFKSNKKSVSLTTNSNIDYKEFPSLSAGIFQLFIYSLIWRLGLHNKLVSKIQLLNSKLSEKLRGILDLNLPEAKKKRYSLKNIGEIPFLLLAPKELDDRSRGFVFGDEKSNQPKIIFITDLIILLFENEVELNYNKNEYLKFSKEINSIELYNKDNLTPKLAYITEEHWKNIKNSVNQIIVKLYMDRLTRELMDANNISYENARLQLALEAKRIHTESGQKLHIQNCYAMAVNKLKKK